MAEFLARINGSRGEASRLGTKESGVTATVASWAGAVTVSLYMHRGEPYARVEMIDWQGVGRNILLYTGPVSGSDDASLRASALHLLSKGNAGPLTVHAASILPMVGSKSNEEVQP